MLLRTPEDVVEIDSGGGVVVRGIPDVLGRSPSEVSKESELVA